MLEKPIPPIWFFLLTFVNTQKHYYPPKELFYKPIDIPTIFMKFLKKKFGHFLERKHREEFGFFLGS
jgi:hypothetical protein